MSNACAKKYYKLIANIIKYYKKKIEKKSIKWIQILVKIINKKY